VKNSILKSSIFCDILYFFIETRLEFIAKENFYAFNERNKSAKKYFFSSANDILISSSQCITIDYYVIAFDCDLSSDMVLIESITSFTFLIIKKWWFHISIWVRLMRAA
jgi:hypothetical protein